MTSGLFWKRCCLERDAAFPGDEIILAEELGLGGALAAGYLNAQLQKIFGGGGNGALAGDDAACIEVDDVAHALGKCGVGGDLDHGCDGVAGGRAEAGCEEHEVGSRAHLCGHALDVVAWSAEQRQAWCSRVLREIENIAHWGHSALARRACGLDRV